MQESDELLHARLNSETARIRWPELERHFARGVLVRVDPAVDLVSVAVSMVRDDKETVARWMAEGKIGVASNEEAAEWSRRGTEFWAVVTAPWVGCRGGGAVGFRRLRGASGRV